MYSHFSYVYFLQSLNDYFSRITNNQIKSYQSNYSSRNILRYNINHKKYIEEFPAVIFTLLPMVQSNAFNMGRRNIGNDLSDEFILLAKNNTKQEGVFLHLSEMHFSLGLRINVHESLQTITFMDRIKDVFPLNRYHYPYEYTEYVEIDRVVDNWDFILDDIENVTDKTERTTGKFFHMGKYVAEPVFKMNSIETEVDNDSMRHGVVVNFDITLYMPNMIVRKDLTSLKDLVPVIDILKEPLEPQNPVYTEINNINDYIDDVVKTSKLIPKQNLDLTNKTFRISTNDANKLGIPTDPSNQPKTLLFIDTDNMKLKKEKQLLNITLKSENRTIDNDNIIFDISEYDEDLSQLTLSDTTLITLSVFGERE